VQAAGAPGDLYLVVRPQLPTATDAEAVELARKLDERRSGDVREGLAL
jgi:hypothetical protein